MQSRFIIEWRLISADLEISEGVTPNGEVQIRIDDGPWSISTQQDLHETIEEMKRWKKHVGRVKWIKGDMAKLVKLSKRIKNI